MDSTRRFWRHPHRRKTDADIAYGFGYPHSAPFAQGPPPYTGAFSWYVAVLENGQSWHVAGGLSPGTPFLLGRHNEHIGWAATTNRPDLIDVYRLIINSDNESRYRFDGKWLPFRTKAVSIDVRQPDGLMKTMSKTLRWAKQGLVISDVTP